MAQPVRDLSGEDARKLIDDILARVGEDFLMHLSWKEEGGKENEIKQHLSIHGTWNAQEIMATGKGRNEQIQQIVMRSMGKGAE